MTSQKRIKANRGNAKKSTGPRTPEGKAKVGQNAVKHGMFSRSIVLACESKDEFDELFTEMLQQYDPQTPMERLLVDRTVCEAWRLERLQRIEREMMDARLEAELAAGGDGGTLGSCFADGALDRLGRYIGRVDRAFHRALKALLDMQRARRDAADRARAGRGAYDAIGRRLPTPPPRKPWPPWTEEEQKKGFEKVMKILDDCIANPPTQKDVAYWRARHFEDPQDEESKELLVKMMEEEIAKEEAAAGATKGE